MSEVHEFISIIYFVGYFYADNSKNYIYPTCWFWLFEGDELF